MKQYFIKAVCMATVAVFTVPAFAQKEKDKDAKDQKDVQQIIITRKGDADDKTVIEINGDKVKINGKDASDNKDVTVHLNRYKDYNALARTRVTPRVGTTFNFNNDAMSLFSEDANRAMLGVVTEGNDKGAEITSITKESAAEKAGLKTGDVITKIDGQKIDDADDVATAVHKHKPGEKIDLTILRNGKEQKMTTELGKWKGVQYKAFSSPNTITGDLWRGVAPTDPITPYGFNGNVYIAGSAPRLGLSVQDTDDGKGVKVLDADEDGNAAKAGIKKDDIITQINDKDVNSTDEISKAVRENREKGTMKVQLMRNGKSQTVEVRMPRRLKTTDL